MKLGRRSRSEILLDALTRSLATAPSRRQFLKIAGAAGGGLLYLLRVTPAYAQTLTATPSCGEAGKTKVCLTGAGWAEPQPLCRYKFFFDGASVAPDQQDGLYGPPLTSFIVPAGAAAGNHTIRVELRLNSPDNLLQAQEIPFKVLNAGAATSITATGAGTGSILITFKPAESCEASCKKIVFIQTVREFVIKMDGTEVLTKATDWALADAPKVAAVAASDGTRIDQTWGVSSPYYEQNGPTLPAAGGSSGSGNVGSSPPSANNATLPDGPTHTPGTFLGGYPIKRAIFRFMSVPYCAEGDDAGKFLGNAVTWEWQQDETPGAVPTITNINTNVPLPDPSSSFVAALNKWAAAKSFTLPTVKTSPCP